MIVCSTLPMEAMDVIIEFCVLINQTELPNTVVKYVVHTFRIPVKRRIDDINHAVRRSIAYYLVH